MSAPTLGMVGPIGIANSIQRRAAGPTTAQEPSHRRAIWTPSKRYRTRVGSAAARSVTTRNGEAGCSASRLTCPGATSKPVEPLTQTIRGTLSRSPKQPKYRKKHDLSLDAFGTTRVRAGYATGSFLPYVTGGLAWGKAQGDIAVSYPHLAKFVELGHTLVEKWYATNPVTYGEVDETHIGWTIGGGFEWKLRHDISLKAEYLYVDLGKETYLFKGPLDPSINQPFNTDSFRSELTFHTVRVGLNYHFNTAE